MEDGIKTFPFPVKLDDRIRMVEAEFGTIGYAVVWKLHQAIYEHGYYLKWDIDTQLLFIDDYRLSKVGRNVVSEIVACCLRRGVFESSMFEKYQILTSERIQETFLTAKARATKVIVDKNYALPVVYTFIENASKKGKTVNIFWKNADISDAKENKGKEKEYIPPNSACARGIVDEALSAFCKRFDITVDGYDATLQDMDFCKLAERYGRSKTFLQAKPLARSLKWICKNYKAILSGKYDDFEEKPAAKKSSAHERGTDILKGVFDSLKHGDDE